MRVFALPHDVAVHGRDVIVDDQEQGFDRGLPLRETLLRLGKLLDVLGGICEGDNLAIRLDLQGNRSQLPNCLTPRWER